MRTNLLMGLLCVAGLSIAVASFADDAAPTTAPTTRPAKVRPIRLTTPWNKVADLTEEQKLQINAIHVETIEKVKALEAAEDEACMALLTAEQKATLEETLAAEAAEKKAKAGKKKTE